MSELYTVVKAVQESMEQSEAKIRERDAKLRELEAQVLDDNREILAIRAQSETLRAENRELKLQLMGGAELGVVKELRAQVADLQAKNAALREQAENLAGELADANDELNNYRGGELLAVNTKDLKCCRFKPASTADAMLNYVRSTLGWHKTDDAVLIARVVAEYTPSHRYVRIK